VAVCDSVSAAVRLARAAEWLAARRDGALIVAASEEAALAVGRAAAGAVFAREATTLPKLAARLAERALRERGLVPAAPLALEAVAARVLARGVAPSLARVADVPGLVRAVVRTVSELRLAGVASAPGDVGALLAAFAAELAAARLADRALVLEAALDGLPAELPPLLLVDVPAPTRRERALVHALLARASDRFVTEPPASGSLTVGTGCALATVSAPGEARECAELARAIVAEAARGVRFDRMAVLLAAPSLYRAPLAEALRRADVPAHFAVGVRRPDPAGRALLALLACAAEGLSARRFAEYLSLGELPGGAAPRAWEGLLVSALVIGGRARWARRLDGLARELELALGAVEDPAGAEADALRRRLAELAALRALALPLVAALAALPRAAAWGAWLAALAALARRALRDPSRVLAILDELAPMAAVGPVELAEVRRVLGRRLGQIVDAPPPRPPGTVLVAPIDAARGLSFEVVLLPGLAERLFPPRIVEDPLLPDVARRALDPTLETQDDRAAAWRLRLRLAAGAAERKLVASYPRLDLEQGRARVPSFYALELVRAATGRLPELAELARTEDAQLGWPAPRDPGLALDEAERDLAVLRAERAAPRPGAARYLLEANPWLARALRARARRRLPKWTGADGLVDPAPAARAALAAHQLGARSFSATALQRFATCPYQFFLYTVHRLAPRDEPEPLDAIDPLSRGALVHEVLYTVLSALRDRGALPLAAAALPEAQALLDATLDAIAGRWADDLAPAIPRVWDDGVAAVRADLHEWLRRVVDADWLPWRFELAFGLEAGGGRDPASRPEPAALECGLLLRGAIDLVERRGAELRATDFKTGRVRATAGQIIDGGSALQPVLYALALEQLVPGAHVGSGRLYFATHAGGYSVVETPLDEPARAAAGLVAATVGGALAEGFLPQAPSPGACQRCDYLAVCGPDVEQRATRVKRRERLEPLLTLRRHR
jgi:hypothetical protein